MTLLRVDSCDPNPPKETWDLSNAVLTYATMQINGWPRVTAWVEYKKGFVFWGIVWSPNGHSKAHIQEKCDEYVAWKNKSPVSS
jgi:hypothetical protein